MSTFIKIGNIEFNFMEFKGMEKSQFVGYYAGKLTNVDINVAWDIIQEHIAGLMTKEEKFELHNKRQALKVKKK
jgi:hypothetical protein